MRRYGLYVLACMALICAGDLAIADHHGKGEDDDNRFSVHGEVRFRGESWSNLLDFTDTDDSRTRDDDFDIWPYRYRMMAKGDLGNDVWVGVEFQGTGVAGGGLFGENNLPFGDGFEVAESGVNIYQGWVKLKDVGDSVLDLGFGRQEIKFDTGLHFSNLPFYNGISHDAITAYWDWERFGIHSFYIRNTESNLDPTGFITCNDSSGFATGLPAGICPSDDADEHTFGVHFKHYIDGDMNHDVAYYLFLQTQNSDASGPRLDSGSIYTLGGRWGNHNKDEGGFSWNIEASVQSGDFQPADPGSLLMPNAFGGNCAISIPPDGDTCDAGGWVFEGYAGYTWEGSTDHTIWGGVTIASGDDDPNDGDQDAFMPLYTDFHKRLGYADLWALSNIEAIYIGYKGMVEDRHGYGATLYMFSKAENEGTTWSPLTGFGGPFIDCPPFGGTTSDCDDDLGTEIDLFYNYYFSNNFSFDVAWSIVDPGDAVEDHFCGVGVSACTDDEGSDTAWRLTYQARARF